MKPSRTLLLSRPLVVFGLVIGFVLAAGSAILSTISIREVASASMRASDMQDTLLEINQLLSSVVDAETGQRGFILTGIEGYLEPYTKAVAQIDRQLARLAARYEHAPAQRVMLERIDRLVAEKKAELSRTIKLRRENEPGPALHIIDSGTGLNTMTALREVVHQLEQHELNELAVHSAEVNRRAEFFQHLGLAMFVTACALAGIGAVLLVRGMHKLEALVTVCAWTRRVKFNGAWVSFEDYLHARFNLRFTHGISEEAAQSIQNETPLEAGSLPSSSRQPGFPVPIKHA